MDAQYGKALGLGSDWRVCCRRGCFTEKVRTSIETKSRQGLGDVKKIIIIQWSIVICHFRRPFGAFNKRLREAPPSMTYDN
jgi:hypothetical protein